MRSCDKEIETRRPEPVIPKRTERSSDYKDKNWWKTRSRENRRCTLRYPHRAIHAINKLCLSSCIFYLLFIKLSI